MHVFVCVCVSVLFAYMRNHMHSCVIKVSISVFIYPHKKFRAHHISVEHLVDLVLKHFCIDKFFCVGTRLWAYAQGSFAYIL